MDITYVIIRNSAIHDASLHISKARRIEYVISDPGINHST